jgi:hypothetical protein
LESVKKRVAIVADGFAAGSTAQQIKDRFLIGYTREGIFQTRPVEQVVDVRDAEAVVVFATGELGEVIEKVRSGTRVFVYGLVAKTEKDARRLIAKAVDRNIPICAATVAAALQELPPMEIPDLPGIGAQIREALVVTHGDELFALDGLASVLEARGGMSEIKKVRTLEGAEVWAAADKEWSSRMLAAALSRTDKAQGNTELDGRTEELVSSRLVQKMAKNPRARIIEHAGRLRTTILVLDGVVEDLLVAVRAGRRLMPGSIYSTQLFQSPKPQQEEFSRMVAAMVDFFESGKAPWGIERGVAMAALNEKIGK